MRLLLRLAREQLLGRCSVGQSLVSRSVGTFEGTWACTMKISYADQRLGKVFESLS
jgi:hypothetical protein